MEYYWNGIGYIVFQVVVSFFSLFLLKFKCSKGCAHQVTMMIRKVCSHFIIECCVCARILFLCILIASFLCCAFNQHRELVHRIYRIRLCKHKFELEYSLFCDAHLIAQFFFLALSLVINLPSFFVCFVSYSFFFPLHYYLLLLKQNVISILFILCFCFDWINMMIWIGIILFVCVCARVQMSNESTSSIILYFSCRILRFFFANVLHAVALHLIC